VDNKHLRIVNKKNYTNQIIDKLSFYEDKILNKEGKIIDKPIIYTDYFLKNDVWHVEDFGQISRLKEEYKEHVDKKTVKTFTFVSNNENIKLEMKLHIYNMIFNKHHRFYTIFDKGGRVRRVEEFINKKYPEINSVLDLDLKKAEIKWYDWIQKRKIKVIRKSYEAKIDKTYAKKTVYATTLRRIYESLFEIFDVREEWEKDKWDIKNLGKYGISYNKSNNSHTLNFKYIKNSSFRKEFKKYLKMRLKNNTLKWTTCTNYLSYMHKFFNYISEIYPSWNNLNDLSRNDILGYLDWLDKNVAKSNRIKNPMYYKNRTLTINYKYLRDIHYYDFDFGPTKDIKKIIRDSDKPKADRGRDRFKIKEIPKKVLSQLMENFKYLNKDIQVIVLIMLETGLRISDVLELKLSDLIRIEIEKEEEFAINTDIRKTMKKDRTKLISKELAEVLNLWINKVKKESTELNNPNGYMFCRYKGKRKGEPYLQQTVSGHLNSLANRHNITDENNKIFKFKNHAFRHTFAMNMLNDGVDIYTIKDYLDHDSTEMTMRYARQRKKMQKEQFDKSLKNGAFLKYNSKGEIVEGSKKELSDETLYLLWQSHKIKGANSPYGTCMQLITGDCELATQPPCLTCNNGNLCDNLLVSNNDLNKYKILIKHQETWVKKAKQEGKIEWVKRNKSLLNKYKEIYELINKGNIIYGHSERI